MSNRFVQFRPLTYTPVTEPLELLKESITNRRKMMDSIAEQEDALNAFKINAIPGTGYESEAMGVKADWQKQKEGLVNYITNNPNDVYGQMREIRKIRNYITNDMLNGKAGAIQNAYNQYVTDDKEYSKTAGKKDSYSQSRYGQSKELFIAANKDIGKFDPNTGRYTKASSFSPPPVEFDIFKRLKEVWDLTPESTYSELKSGRDGFFIIDKKTNHKLKESDILVNNMLNSLKGDAGYIDDLKFRTKYYSVANGLDMSNPDHARLAEAYAGQQMAHDAGQISGYSYNNSTQDLDRTMDDSWKYNVEMSKLKMLGHLMEPEPLGNPKPRQVNLFSTSPALEDASSYWNNLDALTSAALGDIGIKNTGIPTHSMDMDPAKIFHSSLLKFGEPQNFNGEQINAIAKSVGSRLNVDSNDVSSYLSKYYKDPKNENKTLEGALKGFVASYKQRGFDKSPITGFPISVDQQDDLTKKTLQDGQAQIWKVENGRIVTHGADYSMSKFLKDESKDMYNSITLKPKSDLNYKVTDIVPANSKIPKTTYKMTNSSGDVIFVATSDAINKPDSQINAMNYSVSRMHETPSEYTKDGVVLTHLGADSHIGQNVERYLNSHGTSMTAKIDPRQVYGWRLFPASRQPYGRSSDALKYSKVKVILNDGSAVTLIDPSDKSAKGNVDLGNSAREDMEEINAGVFRETMGKPKRVSLGKGQFANVMDLTN